MRARHAGFTILEMILVSVISMVVLAMAVGMTGLMVGVASVSHRQLEAERTLERVSRLFREDVHQAIRVTIPEPVRELALDQTDRLLCELTVTTGEKVRYRVSSGLVREKLEADRIVSIEAFPLDPRYRVGIVRLEDHGKPLIALTVQMRVMEPGSGRLKGKERIWRTVASPGRDLSGNPTDENRKVTNSSD